MRRRKRTGMVFKDIRTNKEKPSTFLRSKRKSTLRVRSLRLQYIKVQMHLGDFSMNECARKEDA